MKGMKKLDEIRTSMPDDHETIHKAAEMFAGLGLLVKKVPTKRPTRASSKKSPVTQQSKNAVTHKTPMRSLHSQKNTQLSPDGEHV